MKTVRTVGAWILVVLCCLCLATGAVAATYTWTGAGGTPAWNLLGNWSGFCQTPCYPNTVDDDAIFPTNADWQCNLITEEIDDLTIQRNVDFGEVGTDPVLRADTVTIVGQSGGSTIATINDGAEITTKAP